jgi:hypothetical protein
LGPTNGFATREKSFLRTVIGQPKGMAGRPNTERKVF